MRTMTAAEMTKANGGGLLWHWKCGWCGRKFITRFAEDIHAKIHHPYNRPVRI